MFKFIKEIKYAIKEGMEEADKELEEEHQAKINSELEKAELESNLNSLPKAEIFGTSLSAPFRTTAFNDWFTLFKSTRESLQEEVLPVHLFTFGDLESLEKSDIATLKKQYEGSFEVNNKEDVLRIVQSFLLGIGIKLESLNSISPKYQPIELISFHENKLLHAWSLSAAASTIIAGVEFNDLSKEISLAIFEELLPMFQSKYSSWNEFSSEFVSDDELIDNDKKRIKRTNQTIKNLTVKAGSPWVKFPLSKL